MAPRSIFDWTALTALAASFGISPTLAADFAAALPNLGGQWGRTTLNLEAPRSGNGPIFNITRKADGTLDPRIPVGDYSNPILQPEAAEILKQRGEISLSGEAFPSAHNQCWPEPVPFTLAIQFGVQILQMEDEVILTYLSDHQVRRIQLNAPHHSRQTMTWQGDSIGHYEGDTLVIDTIGVRVNAYSAVDRNGTPHSEALHVVERYRLIDGQAARDAILRHESLYNVDYAVSADRDTRQYGRGPVDTDASWNGLQVEINVEDQRMFTAPWSALVTYRPARGNWPEAVCAENPRGLAGTAPVVPQADTFDF